MDKRTGRNNRNFDIKIGHVEELGDGKYEIEAELVDDIVGFYQGSFILQVDTNRERVSTY